MPLSPAVPISTRVSVGMKPLMGRDSSVNVGGIVALRAFLFLAVSCAACVHSRNNCVSKCQSVKHTCHPSGESLHSLYFVPVIGNWHHHQCRYHNSFKSLSQRGGLSQRRYNDNSLFVLILSRSRYPAAHNIIRHTPSGPGFKPINW